MTDRAAFNGLILTLYRIAGDCPPELRSKLYNHIRDLEQSFKNLEVQQ
jgi:hypothetical protein